MTKAIHNNKKTTQGESQQVLPVPRLRRQRASFNFRRFRIYQESRSEHSSDLDSYHTDKRSSLDSGWHSINGAEDGSYCDSCATPPQTMISSSLGEQEMARWWLEDFMTRAPSSMSLSSSNLLLDEEILPWPQKQKAATGEDNHRDDGAEIHDELLH